MELEQLQERWQLLDQKLDRTLAMHSALMRASSLQGTRRRINRMSFWPAVDLAFGLGVLLVTGSFMGDHWPQPTLVIPALCLMAAAVLFVISNIHQLSAVSRLSWDAPIAGIQIAVTRIQSARLRQFKWIILLSPLLWLCMMTVGAELIFGVNVIESFDPLWVALNIAFGLLFIPGGMWIADALRRRCQGHRFWRILMDDISGRSLAAAQQELARWAEFGQEEEPAR